MRRLPHWTKQSGYSQTDGGEKMQKINDALYAVLRRELLKEPLREETAEYLADGKRREALFDFAVFHDVGHLVADCFISDGIVTEDCELYRKLSAVLMTAVYRSEQLQCLTEDISRTLEAAGIDHILLKGAVIRGLYPKPWMRTSCDVDLLVKKADLYTAAEILKKELGGAVLRPGEHDLPLAFKNDMHAELHFKLDGNSSKYAAILNTAWNHAVPVKERPHVFVLDNDFTYFYHIAHTARHIKNGGCGIKALTDDYYLNTVCKETPERAALLSGGGLLKFQKSIRALSVRVMTGKSNPETARLERFILSGGTYGTRENELTLKKGLSGELRADRIFLPLKELRYHYPALEKHPRLYPLFAVRRILRLAFITLPGLIKRQLKRKRGQNGQAKAENDIIKELGI